MPKLSFHTLLVVLLGLTAPLSAQQYYVSTLNMGYTNGLGGVAIHPKTGELYFSCVYSDGFGNRIGSVKRLSLTAGLEQFAGNEISGQTDGFGANATFTELTSLTFDSLGNLFVGDTFYKEGTYSHIRKVSPDRFVSTVATNGGWISSLVTDAQGNIYSAIDGGLLKFDSNYNVTTVNLYASILAVDAANNIYVLGDPWAPSYNNWKIATNGEATSLPRVPRSGAMTCDKSGKIYIVAYNSDNFDQSYLLKMDSQGSQELSPQWNEVVLAGRVNPENSFAPITDGLGTNATFSYVSSIAVDDSGTIYVVDNGILRVIGLLDTWRTTQRGSELFVTGYNGPLSNAVTIPSQINGQQVTGIAAYAFAGNTNITSLTIPSGVTTIGTAAFSGCPQLTNVSLPDSVISLGANIFDGDYNLTSFQASVTLQSFLSQYASELGISPMAVSSFTSATQASLFNSIGTGLTNNTGFLGGLTGQILVAGGNYGLATKADLLPLAAKADLLTLASKSELEPLARKSDLTTLASKSELEPLAKKTDLTILATKAELAALTSDKNFVASLTSNPDFLRALAEQITSASTNYGIASKATQTLSFAPLTVTYSKKTKTVSLAATSSAKLTPITYTFTNGSSPLGSISGNVLTLTGVKGTTSITASQAGTPYVNPAMTTVNLTVK